jgi:protein AATF/BFR2
VAPLCSSPPLTPLPFCSAEIDLEADAFGAGPALEASDEELGANVPGRGRERPRLRGEIALQSKEYSGRKSSRQALFDEPEPSEDDADEASLDTDEDGSLEDASALEDEGSEDRGTPSSKNEPAAVARNAAAPMLELTNGIGYANGSGGIDEDEGAALEREYRETRQAEADALAGLKERAEKERRKAAAVASQRRLWNSGLELRILLQRSLQGGNRLPQPEGRSAVAVVDPELDASLKSLAKDAAGAVEDFLDLLGALEEQNTALGRAADTAGVNRARGDADADDDADLETGRQDAAEGNAESEQLWQRLDACYSRFAPYRDASIDRWHRKTVLTTGVAARGGLQALNQSVSTQVATLLQDGGRLLERTRLPKRQRTVLCEVRREEAIEVSGDSVCYREGCRVFHLPIRNLEILCLPWVSAWMACHRQASWNALSLMALHVGRCNCYI